MEHYRELIKYLFISLNSENRYDTLGSLLLSILALSPIYFLSFGISYFINNNYNTSLLYATLILLFTHHLITTGFNISKTQTYEKDLQYHYDVEEKIRYFIILCKSKKIDEKLITEEIKLILDMLHDPYYYGNPIKTLNKKIDEIENNKTS